MTALRITYLIRRPKGFTLLELLVVVAIMAAIAGAVVGAFRGVGPVVDDGLVRAEMQEIAKAIRQFKQDTGYYPGEGPFALSSVAANAATDCPGLPAGDGGIDRDSLPAGAGVNWFESPANFRQLYLQPEICDNHPHVGLMDWNADTGRGWRGPYLKDFVDGYVDISSDINPGANSANGDPVDGTAAGIADVRGIADPYERGSVTVAGVGTLMDWVLSYGGGIEELRGRPYLLFLDPDNFITDCIDDAPCLVSMGPDGDYTQGAFNNDNDYDLVLSIE